MKKRSLIIGLAIALIVLLCILVALAAQRNIHARFVDHRFAQPVFREDQEIVAVTFDSSINDHGTESVPEEDLQEIVAWLRQFRLGTIVESGTPLAPGSGSVRVTVTYADGSRQTTSLDSIRVQDTLYLIDHPSAPQDAMPPLD